MTDKKEWLFVKFSDDVFKVPAILIAKDRAKYYADREAENEEHWQEIFDDEVDFALTDTYELEDWATNNMDWLNLAASARIIQGTMVDYSKEWVNAEKWAE